MKKQLYNLKRGNEERRDLLVEDAADFLGVSSQSIVMAKKGKPVRGWDVQMGGTVELRISRRCEDCGKRIASKKSTLYCEKCREKRKEQAVQNKVVPQKGKRKSAGEVPYEQKSPLSKAAWDARQAGMNYGKYVGLQRQKEEREKDARKKAGK